MRFVFAFQGAYTSLIVIKTLDNSNSKCILFSKPSKRLLRKLPLWGKYESLVESACVPAIQVSSFGLSIGLLSQKLCMFRSCCRVLPLQYPQTHLLTLYTSSHRHHLLRKVKMLTHSIVSTPMT